MKAKMSYQKKRALIIVAIIAVLAIAATAGTVAYINGNRRAAAATPEEVADVTPNTQPQNGNNGQAPTTLPDLGDQTNPAGPVDGADNANAGDNGVAPVVPGNGNANAGNGNANAGNGNGAAVPNQDYTQTTVIPGGGDAVLVSEIDARTWVPVGASRLAVNANINTNFLSNVPNLLVNKSAYMQGDSSKQDNAIQVGEEIEYVISVKNDGTAPASNIYVYDKIPEGTKLVDGQNLKNNNGTLSWKIDTIDASEIVSVSFKVEVLEITENGIVNTASIDGESTNTTATPVITTGKTAQVIDFDGNVVEGDRAAKVGEKIRYTITVMNNSAVEGTVTVKDTAPEGTKLAGEIVMGNDTITEETLAEGAKVSVQANETKAIVFEVEVLDTTKPIKNAATIGNTKTEEQTTSVANIQTIKQSQGSSEQLHEMDTITYTLTSTNTGDAEGTVKVADKVPVGTTLVGDIQVTDKNGARIIENSSAKEIIENGIDVTVSENGGTATIQFTVMINSFKAGDEGVTVDPETNAVSRKVVNAEATQDGISIIEQDPEDQEDKITEDDVKKEFVTITVDKMWTEPEGLGTSYRPDITFGIYNAAGEEIQSESYTGTPVVFSNLPKYVDDVLVVYTAKETTTYNGTVQYYKTAEDQTVTINENNTGSVIIENIFDETTVSDTTVTITKVWNDNSNAEGLRPGTDGVTFTLKADGKATNAQAVVEENNNGTWTVTYSGLQTYNEQFEEIAYTVEEGEVNNYRTNNNTVAAGGTITNTLKWENITTDSTDDSNKIIIVKNWVDDEQEANNAGAGYQLVDLWKGSHWFNNGIGNTLSEEARDFILSYLKKQTGRNDIELGITYRGPTFRRVRVVYTYRGLFGMPAVRMVFLPRFMVVENAEADSSLIADTTRPAEITVTVSPKNAVSVTNGTTTSTVQVKATEGWQKEVTGLRVYDDNGNKIEYKVEEFTVDKYTTTIGDPVSSNNGKTTTYIITNTLEEEENITTNIVVNKIWNDNNNVDGLRPESVTVTLYANGTSTGKTLTLTANDGWTGRFGDLPTLDDDDNLITYTVEENVTGAYTSSVEIVVPEVAEGTTAQEAIYNITNVLNYTTINNVTVEVEKEFTGETGIEEAVAVRPATISATIKGTRATAENTTSVISENVALTKKEDGTYEAVTKTGLPKYNYDGSLVEYRVEENLEGNLYTASYGEAVVSENGNKVTLKIINTLHPENIMTEATELVAKKEWRDDTSKVTRPTSVTFQLKAGDVNVGEPFEMKKGANDTDTLWTKTLDAQPKYNADGTKINYSVVETTDLTGSHYQAAEPDDNDPLKVINEINYASFTDGIVKVTKNWIDDPTTTDHTDKPVTIKLYTVEGTTKTLVDGKTYTGTLEDDSSYEFTGLRLYKDNGDPYVYTVTEDQVEGYRRPEINQLPDEEGYISSFEIRNELENTTVNITGTKTWVEPSADYHSDEIDNMRIVITQNKGAEDEIVVFDRALSSLEDSKYEFSGIKYRVSTPEEPGNEEFTYDLDENEKLIPYTYTVEEILPEGTKYESIQNGYNFINRIQQENNVTVTVTKKWIDPTNTHPEIGLTLYQNGTPYNATATKSGEGNTFVYTYSGLPKYNYTNNTCTENVYTVAETTVPTGYSASEVTKIDKNQFEITNTIMNTTDVSVNGTKVFKDSKGNTLTDVDYSNVTIQLYKNDTPVEGATTTVNENGKFEFTRLEKYTITDTTAIENVYTVKETGIDENDIITINGVQYKMTQEGNTITNTEQLSEIKVKKTGVTNDINGNGIVDFGDTITYTILAKNDGNAAGSVTIKDAKLGELVAAGIVAYNDNTSLAQELVAGKTVTVAGNDSVVLTFSVTVKGTTPGTTVTNTITVEGGEDITVNPPTATIEQSLTTITKSERIEGAHIVIAMDRSESMDYVNYVYRADGNYREKCTDSHCTKNHVHIIGGTELNLFGNRYHSKLTREIDAIFSLLDAIYPNAGANNNGTDITIIGYADAANTYTIGSATKYEDIPQLKAKLSKVYGSTSTNFTECLNMIDSKLTSQNKEDNYVIFMGDGNSNSIFDWEVWGNLQSQVNNIKSKANVFTIGLDASGKGKERLQNMVSGIGTYTDSTASTNAITSAIEAVRRTIVNNGNPETGKTENGILQLDSRAYIDSNHPVVVKINGSVYQSYTSLDSRKIDFRGFTIPANATVEVSYFIQ